ncbi:MAG: SDR family NAD(P)-dependent oxidoreductase [Bacteroidia bacterium]|nr:SDR family NAD(P)-dependent oxidoreductase [Bacteroidia bacterium]
MNKFIVVSGGSKGIGKEIIRKFAASGFDVATCARQDTALKDLQTEIEATYPVKLYYQLADLSDRAATQSFANYVLALNRPVDVLVNNAGLFIPGALVKEDDEALDKMIRTNLYSAYDLTRRIVPAMVSRREGYVFNMCSIASLVAYPNGGSYTISKFALLGFSKVLREEMKPHGIRVSAVLPGATLTASWAGVDIPAERFMKASDVAEGVYAAYALSPRSVVEEIVIRPQLGDL